MSVAEAKDVAAFRIVRVDGRQGPSLRLLGELSVYALAEAGTEIRQALAAAARTPAAMWDLRGLTRLDSAGALILWRLWGERFPAEVEMTPAQRQIFSRLMRVRARLPSPRRKMTASVAAGIARWAAAAASHLLDFLRLLGALALDLVAVLRQPADFPWRELSAHLDKAGARALPITAVVGFLIGVVLAYLSSLQLARFGADAFIIHVVGYGVIRELGPMLVAVLLAGRSGSAMTAQLGTMRVTEEIDAAAAMGVPLTLRLVLPKVLALAIAMPLVTLWTTAAALFGGMVAAEAQLGIGYGFFLDALPRAVPIANLWIGLAKGVAFGAVVALIACHFGLRAQPNTESLARNTTASVVAAITAVIVIDAIFAVLTRRIGLPGT